MKNIVFYILIIVFLVASTAPAKQTFVDWRGGFYFDYPDDWYEIEYRQVNIFLGMQNVSRDEFDYDVALALKDTKPFWEVPYVFVSSFDTGKLTPADIDSAKKKISSEYGNTCKVGRWSTGETALDLGFPVYDKTLNAIAVRDVFKSPEFSKMFLQMRVFHENGIAVFSCYAPNSIYNEVEEDFFKMALSLKTDDLHKAAGDDSAQIVNINDRDYQTLPDSEKISTPMAEQPDKKEPEPRNPAWIIIIIGIIVLAAACYIFLSKKSSK